MPIFSPSMHSVFRLPAVSRKKSRFGESHRRSPRRRSRGHGSSCAAGLLPNQLHRRCFMHHWLRSVGQILNGHKPARKAAYRRLNLEALESRCLLDANVLQTNLVSDLPGVAQHLDPQLVNPWGIAESGGSPFWISDNEAGVSTLSKTTGDKPGLVD